MANGYPINWALPSASLVSHPLYIKYNSSTFGSIQAADVKGDLSAVLATAENAEVCAYLSWLLRTLALVA